MSKYNTLSEAARFGTFVDMAEYVIENKNPNELFDSGQGFYMSTLHLFASAGSTEGVQVLFGIKADPNVKDSNGESPLHYAVLKNHKKVVEMLLNNGGNVNAKSHTGETSLHMALIEEFDEIAALLITRGADVNIPNNRGITPKQVGGFNKLKKMGFRGF